MEALAVLKRLAAGVFGFQEQITLDLSADIPLAFGFVQMDALEL